MIRPYVIARDRATEEAKYQQFKNHPLVAFNSFRRDESEETRNWYLAMLRYADVVIPIFSTMAIEAALFDRPTISIGFDGYKKRPFHQSVTRLEQLTHFRHVLRSGSVKIVRSFDELSQSINRYLHAPEDDREARRRLIETMCYRPDGRASERIADFVLRKPS
jgi:CDP-glycerol glycerophosphotransferase (TagB/SpsB family)